MSAQLRCQPEALILLSRRACMVGVSSLAVVICISGVDVHAQSLQAQPDDVDETLEIEEIVVTGSRIGRESIYDTMAPTLAISGEELEKRSFTNVADALNELPGFVAGQSPNFGQNRLAAGVNFANMFGLGTQRTLTLVDGKRFVSSNPPSIAGLNGGQQVDLNVIPLALIDRVETVGVGGAPIYGSDAIAGTINIIMKDDFEGFEISGQYGTVQNGGDPESYQAQAVWGANTGDGRGNVALGLEYNRDEGVSGTEFPSFFGAQPSFGEIPRARDVDGDGELDDVLRIFNDIKIAVEPPPERQAITPTGLFLPFGPQFGFPQDVANALSIFPNADGLLQINENGDVVSFDPGMLVGNDPFFSAGGDGIDFDDIAVANLISPVERVTGMAVASYEIFDWLNGFGQFNFANTEATSLGALDGVNVFVFPDESAAIGLPVDTPFLGESARQTLLDVGAQDVFFINRSMQDITNNGRSDTESFLWRFTGGFRGEFEVLGRSWDWEFSANYGQSDVDSTDVDINDGRFFNAIDAIQLSDADIQSVIDADNGIDSVEGALVEIDRLSGTEVGAAGSVICRAVLEAARGEIPLRGDPVGSAANDVRPNVDGCIPLNILGPARPQAAIDFVQLENIFQSDIEQRVFNLNLAGEVVELPAGWVEVVAGYETRRERGSFKSSEGAQIGLGREAPVLATAGEFSTDEAFFELSAPILSSEMEFGSGLFGTPLIDRLTLEGSARVVDNSVTGRDTVWTGGGRLAFGGLASDLMIRGNFTQSTRSPSIQELFSPRSETTAFGDDPCDFRFRSEGPVPANRIANCNSIGLGPEFTSLAVNAFRFGTTGGNSDLEVERADAWTVGGVFTPRWIPGLTLSVDALQINISNRITVLTLTQQLEACFDQDPGNFDPNAGICATFQRDQAGQIVDFEIGFQNAAASRFKAIQMEALYDFSLSDLISSIVPSWSDRDFGTVRLSSRAFHRIRNEFSVVGEEAGRTIGSFEEPKWNGTFDFTWTRGPARLFWRVEWQDSSDLDPQSDNFFEDLDGSIVDDTSARIINNGAFTYTFFGHIDAQIAVDNVFNREPTALQIAAGDFSIDEILGRKYKFNLTTRF